MAAGEEDDEALADQVRVSCVLELAAVTADVQATLKDREWDNWKDENPRGIGNKMGKRF